MPTPRARQASTSPSWPHLTLFAVYSARPLVEPSAAKLSDEELEAAKILYFHSTDSQGTSMTPERKRRLMGTVMGVADFAKMMTKSGKDNRIRSVRSSKRRMVWIEPEDGIFVHATLAMPRQASRRHTREASTATTSTARSLPSDAPSIPLDDQLLLSALESAYYQCRLQSGSISGLLEKDGKEGTMRKLDAFWSPWVAKWDLTGLSNPEKAFDQVLGGLSMSPILTPPILAQFDPLVAQFGASNPSVYPILLHNFHVLHRPDLSSSFLDPESLAALVHHILALHSLTLRSTAEHVENAQPDPLQRDASASWGSSSNWTSSALSYLDPRNVPLPTFSSTAASSFLVNPFGTSFEPSSSSSSTTTGKTALRKEFAQLRKESRRPTRDRTDSTTSLASTVTDTGSLRSKKEASRHGRGDSADAAVGRKEPGRGGGGGGWGLRTVSKGWSKLGAALGGGTTPEIPALPGTETPTSSVLASPPPPVADELEVSPVPPSDEAASTKVGSGSVAAGLAKLPETPTVELAPEVNEEDLREAMKGIELRADNVDNDTLTNAEQLSTDDSDRDRMEQSAEQDKVLEFFAGKNDDPFEVRVVQRGSLLLALASRPETATGQAVDLELVRNRAARMLEAVETLIEGAATASVTSTQPAYTIKSEGLLHTRLGQHVGAKSDSDTSQESDLETISAFLDARRALNSSPRILESLTRLPTSSTWLSLTRSYHLFPSLTPTSTAVADPDTTSSAQDEEEEKEVQVLAILPAKNPRASRETTLVEAAEAARRIEKKWVAQRCGM